MKALLPRMVFLSAELTTQSDLHNDMASTMLETTLMARDYHFIKAIGCYKEATERSFGVICERPWTMGVLRLLAKDLGQESIMVREPDGSCWLVYCHGTKEEYIGQWQEISKDRSRGLSGYTVVNGKIYAAI